MGNPSPPQQMVLQVVACLPQSIELAHRQDIELLGWVYLDELYRYVHDPFELGRCSCLPRRPLLLRNHHPCRVPYTELRHKASQASEAREEVMI